ncbi:Fur family transcriptional regulator [Flavivirga rizhaonensis]|uniref:Transcriptional repressor n=1 Tax=Flavivirga rizhaonensis TaxID=2559571 RepID=A0A4S1DZ78_9FLAO|nr:transcriptional repressor [Flavivirga rizhaonensis]TGV03547.1 transcriptional repressor [Flavivirga rizhaonensis]
MKRRKTQSQEEILEILKDSNSALNHDMLQAKLTTKIDRATIYRVLNRFSDDGLVHKVIGDDGKQYFAFCLNCDKEKKQHSHNHFHFKCLKCGKVECLKNEIDVSLPKGYTTEAFNGLISGYCSNCS